MAILNWIHCGGITPFSFKFATCYFFIFESGFVSTLPNSVKSILGIGIGAKLAPIFSVLGLVNSPLTKFSTSSMSILFLFPPPFTKERLTPKLRANFLTDGLACPVLFSSLCTLSPIGIGVSLAAFFFWWLRSRPSWCMR